MTSSTMGSEARGAQDFDFWLGRWRVENDRLVSRLTGCEEWEHFEARCHARRLPGGIGNLDEWVPVDWRPGFVGMTFRIHHPDTGQWSLYWVDNAGAAMQPPVVGGFVNGVGQFEGPDVLRGKPILVRFTWSHITADSARWEQAFSEDAGTTWETNWRMRMTRIPE